MTDVRPDSSTDPAVSDDPEITVAHLIDSIERSGWSVIEITPIPPVDHDVIEAARVEARAAAETAGRGPGLSRAQRTMAEWTLARYQRAGFGAAYLSGWLDAPAERLEVVSLLVDAVTGYALLDLLPEETAATPDRAVRRILRRTDLPGRPGRGRGHRSGIAALLGLDQPPTNDVVELSVRGDECPAVDGTAAFEVGRSTAGLLDQEGRCRRVPGP